MSSSQPASRRRLVGHPRTWSLRTRITVILTALLTVVCLAVGVGTELALRGFLIGQLDAKLRETGHLEARLPPHLARTPPGVDAAGGSRTVPGLQPDMLRAQIYPSGTVGLVYLVQAGQWRIVGDPGVADRLSTVRTDAEPVSVDLGDRLGEYRVQARDMPGGGALVTALPLATVEQTLVRMALFELLVAVAALGVGGTAGALIVRRTLRPLRRVAATAARVAELPLDRGEVALSVRVPATDADPGTEVGQVGAAINRMLSHVSGALSARHASEQRVRQFVADASHELRTPLTAIRGYAELTHRWRPGLPADVSHAIGRVESESGRMTALVEDLLLLARLDAGRPLARDRVDLTKLVVDAVSDAQVAGPRHTWRLILPTQPVTVTGDAARLYQVLTNLLGNARTHTPPATTVRAGLRVEGSGVVVTISDDGPGIPAQLLPEVFERFARGDSSRSRAAGSTGLGMAIVAAVVAAHGGRAGVASVPGRTTVTVWLPR